jgi:chromosome segregation ATPase
MATDGTQDGTTNSGTGQQGDPAGQAPPEDVSGLKSALATERDARAAKERALQLTQTERDTARTNLSTVTAERDDLKTKYEPLATEVEVLRAQVSTSQKRATDADRYEAAHAAGLDLSWASRLQGTKKEEWEADAKTLAASLGGSNGRRQIPAPDPSLGHGSGTGRTSAGSVTSRMQEILAEQAAAAGTQR